MAKSLKVIGLILFLIVDIIAVVMAVKHVNSGPEASDLPSIVSTTTPAPTAAATESTSPETPTLTGLSVTGGIVVTYAAGSCDKPGTAELNLSSDQGGTFVEVALPLVKEADANGDRAAAVTRILAVVITSSTELSLVGDDADCEAREYKTSDGGQNWKQASTVGDWYVDQGRVGTPAGVVDPECEATSVSPLSERNAKVACTDGQIRGTDDVGDTWVGLGQLDNLTAATFGSLRDGFGIVKEPGCRARAYSTGSAGGDWTALGCISKSRAGTAMGGAGGFVAALVGGDIFVSSDQGETWEKS